MALITAKECLSGQRDRFIKASGGMTKSTGMELRHTKMVVTMLESMLKANDTDSEHISGPRGISMKATTRTMRDMAKAS